MDKTVAEFVEYLSMTPKEHAIYASIPKKLDRLARSLFRDRVHSMQTHGSVRSGLASIIKYGNSSSSYSPNSN